MFNFPTSTSGLNPLKDWRPKTRSSSFCQSRQISTWSSMLLKNLSLWFFFDFLKLNFLFLSALLFLFSFNCLSFYFSLLIQSDLRGRRIALGKEFLKYCMFIFLILKINLPDPFSASPWPRAWAWCASWTENIKFHFSLNVSFLIS